MHTNYMDKLNYTYMYITKANMCDINGVICLKEFFYCNKNVIVCL